MSASEPRPRRVELPSRGGTMAALEFGPADRPVDLVFSHANGFNARTYRTLLAPVAAGRRILAIDMRGHGLTELPTDTEGRTSWENLHGDLEALLDVLDLSGVVLSGHSMGGTASLLTAATRPERVRSLVLFDPVIMGRAMLTAPPGVHAESPLVQGALRRRAVFPDRETAYRAYHGRGAFRTWTDAQLADYVADGFRDLPDGTVTLSCTPAWEASNFTAHAHDPWQAFAASRCPIRILRAEIASTCRIDGEEEFLAATGRVSVETLPGTTHFLPMERPEVVERELRAALA